MAAIVLVTGGARSGKSTYAEKRAESKSCTKLYIATCPPIDQEIKVRIDKHIEARRNKGWFTVEEELDIAGVLRKNVTMKIVLVDCLTLWINNLLFHSKKTMEKLAEGEITSQCLKLIETCRMHNGTVFFVTNEVGSGIVPQSSESRLYRDLVGQCNQVMATHANEVVLVSCGIPLTLKKNINCIRNYEHT